MNTPCFQLDSASLESGSTLLEASAGTGKTYTLAGLFLRLLLERRWLVSEILVVTFTEAATAELRLRIRRGLLEARAALQSGESTEPLLKRFLTGDATQRAGWLAQLQAALEAFDEAPVLTIHGFCQRVLQESAFETGSGFHAELEPDSTPVLREVADQFWRQHLYEASEIEVLFARAAGLSPDRLLELLQFATRHRDLIVRARAAGSNLETLAQELASAFDAAGALWRTSGPAIRACFGSQTRWGKTPYSSDEKMAVAFASLEQLFTRGQATPAVLEYLALFESHAMQQEKKAKTKEPVPSHAFFTACEKIGDLQADYASRFQAQFLAEFPEALRRLRERDQTLGFDDLLTRLRDALRGPGGSALRARLQRQYRAVLIDEFQDTDPVQFEIFDRAFNRPDSPLYLVGDPKQAIYSFRGADVFAYLGAHDRVTHRHTLGENFRSESALVAGLNTLFSPTTPRPPFALEAIHFHPVAARGLAERAPLLDRGERRPPLHFWFWDPPPEITQKEAQQQCIADAVAREIVRLLSEDVRLGPRRVQPSDVAVLVETHAQAERVAATLRQYRVPAVLQTQESVWKTFEAAELERVLAAVAEPGKDSVLRGALATTLLAVDAPEIAALDNDDLAGSSWRRIFREHAERWEREGFLAMYETFVRQHEIRTRLLAQAEGERRLTNLGHLAELLHTTATERRFGPHALRLYLAERRADPSAGGEEALLRLERDDAAVQLVTIHRSKGLEYPIVFCPFLLRSAKARRDEPAVFHDPAAQFALTLDLGTESVGESSRQMEGERFAENLRLTYVALTRAKHRCYVVWGQLKGADSAALGWLLHSPLWVEGTPLAELPELSRAYIDALDAPQRRADLEALAARAAKLAPAGSAVQPIALSELPSDPIPAWESDAQRVASLHARKFEGAIRRDWGITSFSGLIHGRQSEEADHEDGAGASELVEGSEVDPLSHFRGARAGTCWHEIFERLHFDADESAAEACARAALAVHGFPIELAPAVAATVRRTLGQSLSAGFALSEVKPANRLHEWGFHLPIRNLSPVRLSRVFAPHLPNARGSIETSLERASVGDLDRLQFRPLQGFLTGFVDLVFRQGGKYWIVDWKSNWLGATPRSYEPRELAREMGSEHYGLQYHLYTVALDAWLQDRDPQYRYESHFGGVYYLFLRGVGTDPQRPELGVVFDRPTHKLIHDLRTALRPDSADLA